MVKVKIPEKYRKKVIEYYTSKIKDKEVKEKVESVLSKLKYEEHLEAIIRHDFKKFFPGFKIIDKGRHHRTISGNYIDILAKKKDTIYVIEIKRVENPYGALAQLLDYINQIKEEFKTDKVKGVLICPKVDDRLIRAVKEINSRGKEEVISLMEYSINMELVR